MPPELFSAGPYGVIALVVWYLINRLNKLEARVDASEAKSSRILALFERVCEGYKNIRRDLLTLALRMFKAGALSEEEYRDIERTPELDQLLRETRAG